MCRVWCYFHQKEIPTTTPYAVHKDVVVWENAQEMMCLGTAGWGWAGRGAGLGGTDWGDGWRVVKSTVFLE